MNKLVSNYKPKQQIKNQIIKWLNEFINEEGEKKLPYTLIPNNVGGYFVLRKESITPLHLSCGLQLWFPSKVYIWRTGKSNFTVKKSDKHYRSHVWPSPRAMKHTDSIYPLHEMVRVTPCLWSSLNNLWPQFWILWITSDKSPNSIKRLTSTLQNCQSHHKVWEIYHSQQEPKGKWQLTVKLNPR